MTCPRPFPTKEIARRTFIANLQWPRSSKEGIISYSFRRNPFFHVKDRLTVEPLILLLAFDLFLFFVGH